jgi:nitrous oxidase accessory protein
MAGRTILATLLFSGPAAADTWTVGGRGADFPFIAPAIAAAADGDVIVVRAGVYREDLVLDRRLTLVGEGSPLLYGTGAGSVIEIRADGCEVRGFRIEGTGTGLTNHMDAAIEIASNRNVVAGNRMRRVFYGVVIAGGSENRIVDNEIAGLADQPYGRRGDGIYVYRGRGNRVSGNHVIGQRDGIYFQYAPGGAVEGNVVDDSRYGLHDMFSDGTRIARNVFRGSFTGANIMNSARVVLEANRFERNRSGSSVGLSLKQCDDSTVSGNLVYDNLRGVQIDGSSRNTFEGNRFVHNDTAIRLLSSAEQNVFSGNEFDGNWSDAVISGGPSGTRWSANGRGNRWSRYRGFDFDGDGVGEAPHPILGSFARLEGTNPGVRLFLQSPAAAALDLASHLAPGSRADAIDPAPLVTKRSAGAEGRGAGVGALFALALPAVMLTLAHRRRRPGRART